MMVQILYTFAALMLMGLVLLVFGVRGRKLNNHPVCRGCGFDLDGVLPAGVTCPECGAGLKRAKAVRQGARRKRWFMAGFGLVLMLLPLVSFLVIGGAILSGSDVNRYKPVRLLMLEARLSGPSLAEDAAKEILDRFRNNKLSEDQAKRVVAAALDFQADTSRPWCTEWGDFIEEAFMQGKATKDDHNRFMDQSAVLECKVRPTLGQGERAPVVIKLKEARAGSASQFLVMVLLDSATIGDQPVATRSTDSSMIDQPWPGWPLGSGGKGAIGSLMVSNANAAMMFGGFEMTASTVLAPDGAIGPGPAKVELAVRCIGEDMSAFRSGAFPLANADRKGTLHAVTLNTHVLGPDEQAVRLIEPTDAITSRLVNVLTPNHVMQFDRGVNGRSLQQMVQVGFSIGGAATPFAFDVFLRIGEREHRLGQITSGEIALEPGVDSFMGYGMGRSGSGNQRMVMGQVSDEVPDTVDLIFRPSESAGKKTIDLKEIYGGEVVVKNVKVQKFPG